MSDMQKIIILCAIALILIGGIFYYLLNVPNTAPESTSVEGETAGDTNTTPTTEAEATDEIAADEYENIGDDITTKGTDVGMEYPVPDGEGAAASGMPVPGNENVDEMVVTEVDDTDSSVDTDAKVFTLTGKSFEFSETELRVSEGDTVTINFESTDGFHDWVVDEFDAATARVQTGGKTSVTFVADKKGSFEYYCSVGSHRELGMVGTLIVE